MKKITKIKRVRHLKNFLGSKMVIRVVFFKKAIGKSSYLPYSRINLLKNTVNEIEGEKN